MNERDPVDAAPDNLDRRDGKRLPTRQIVALLVIVLLAAS